MSDPISLKEQGMALKDLINHLTDNLEFLGSGGNDQDDQSGSDGGSVPSSQVFFEPEETDDYFEFKELDGSIFEAIDLLYPTINSLLQEQPGCYTPLTNEAATNAEMTPVQLASANQTIEYLNALSVVSDEAALPMSITRPDAVSLVSSSIAVNMPIASFGLVLRILGLLKKIYDLLKKLWKVLFGVKKHIRKIKQAKKLKDGGMITAGQAAKMIAKHAAALALKIGEATSIANELRKKAEQLRKEGKEDEAKALEKRVKLIEKQIKEAQKELDKIKDK